VEIAFAVPIPIEITATPTSHSEIELNWLKNEENNSIILLTNTVNEFGAPQKGHVYEIGEMLSDGGKVLYFGDADKFSHSDLEEITTYYYKLFSYNEDYNYSKGIECEATTWCAKVEFTLFEGFEEGIYPCWEQENVEGNSYWVKGRGNDGGFPNNAFEGNFNVFFKMERDSLQQVGNITRLILPTLLMAEFNSIRLSFTLYNQSRGGLVDELSIYYRTSTTEDWILWRVYNENQKSWLSESIILPEIVDTEEIYICFQGMINGGYGICIDNILVEGYDGVGVVENDLNSRINLFPNPTTGELTITNFGFQISGVEIFDVYGRMQKAESKRQKAEGVVLNISHLNSGIYFIKIYTDAGEVVKKVVKE
jgi:hypothetical protein